MIIYLHGFASSGVSDKVTQLRDAIDDRIKAPDLPFDPDEVERMVHALVLDFISTRHAHEKLIFIGTSLGAFYANYFGQKYDCPVILVNPSVTPSETLREKLGVNRHYITSDEFWVTVAHLEQLDKMKKYADNSITKCSGGVLIHLFLAENDEVIPYQCALEKFKNVASVTVTPDGEHRYIKHWDKVIAKAKEILHQ